MLVPIRCFTCGAVIADKYRIYQKRVKNGEEPEKVLNDLNVKRYCCRRMLLTSVEIIHQVLPYYEVLARRREDMQLE